ncbi:MAG: glycosyltransferase [Halofilum sp. (in: g-proteobacteria)]|nr:glycosyltransferase [Halofilum sp. (in: g-proteobacteria)]
MSAAPVLIAAGGTGGHVFPALAVAEALRAAAIPVVWMGTRRGLEARVVPAAGIEIEWLAVGGLRGKGWATRLLAPLALTRAVAGRRSACCAGAAPRAAARHGRLRRRAGPG